MSPIRLPTEDEIRNISSVTQLAITTGVVLVKQVVSFIKYLAKQRGVKFTNEELDAITKQVMAMDELRKALADAEAKG